MVYSFPPPGKFFGHSNPLEDFEKFNFPKISIVKDHNKEWRWYIKAANHKIIGASTEGYINKSDCISNLKQIGNIIIDLCERELRK